MRVEKYYQHGLDVGPLKFQFLRVCLTNPFRTQSLCFGVIGITPGPIPRNKFVKNNVCIGHGDNVLARCDWIFPLLRCQGVWNETCTQLFLSQIILQNPKNYSLGDVQRFWYHSWCYSRGHFITKSATAAIFTSDQVDFGRPILSSNTNSLPSRNRNYYLKRFIGSEHHSHRLFAPVLMFLSQTDWLWNNILWQLFCSFPPSMTYV